MTDIILDDWAIPYGEIETNTVRIQCRKCGMLMPHKIWGDIKQENWHCGNCGNGTGENFIPNTKEGKP